MSWWEYDSYRVNIQVERQEDKLEKGHVIAALCWMYLPQQERLNSELRRAQFKHSMKEIIKLDAHRGLGVYLRVDLKRWQFAIHKTDYKFFFCFFFFFIFTFRKHCQTLQLS